MKLVSIETTHLPSEGGEDDRPVIESINEDMPALLSSEGATPALTAAKNKFSTAFDAFDDALKDSDRLPATAIAAEKDYIRDTSWRNVNQYIKTMMGHPVEATRIMAGEIKNLIDKYGDPTGLAQTEESGVLHNLIQDLQAIDSSKRTAIAFDPWLNNLSKSEEEYLDAVKQRTSEQAERVVGIVKQARLAADTAYRELVEAVNAHCILNGDAPYSTFIDHVNALIDRQRTVLKARATNAKKKKMDDDRPIV